METNFGMDTVVVMECIICTKKRRGDGKEDPIRVITEVFTKDGKLIAEFDPIRDSKKVQFIR